MYRAIGLVEMGASSDVEVGINTASSCTSRCDTVASRGPPRVKTPGAIGLGAFGS